MNKDELLARLEEIGAQGPKRSLGQNFLISENIIGRIIKAVQRNAAQEIIEIGPGLGSLTDELITLGQPLTLIELDQKFIQYWQRRLAGLDRKNPCQIISGDALRIDWKNIFQTERALLVSNLPYQISSSLVIDLSMRPHRLSAMILMFQKEVAQRITAVERSKDYGLLTVIAQNFWQIDFLCECGPRDYFPAPNVAGRVLVFILRKDIENVLEESQRLEFLKFVKAGFSHRRKHLYNNLRDHYFSSRDKSEEILLKAFEHLQLSRNARAEELSPSLFKDLFLLCR